MDQKEILRRVDHTILKPEATWPQVQVICDEALWGNCASVCIPPCFVSPVAEYLQGRVPVCTVLGFPHGNVDTASKCFEAQRAIAAGAAELDMVINLGFVKQQRWDALLEELRALRAVCEGKILKVIIETCLLEQEEKRRLCHLVSESGADFIKTSTGFSTGGAALADVQLFRENVAPSVRIKASGGIRDFAAAEAFVAAGAVRLGSSALVALAREG